jgi:hypothetical protein
VRIAGVRLAGGEVVWVEAGDVDVQPLDDAVVSVAGGEFSGTVIVTPEALLRPVTATGGIVGVSSRTAQERDCTDLPGADMPPLGSGVDEGVVVAVDAVNRTATIEMPDGTRTVTTLPA